MRLSDRTKSYVTVFIIAGCSGVAIKGLSEGVEHVWKSLNTEQRDRVFYGVADKVIPLKDRDGNSIRRKRVNKNAK